MNNNTTFIGSFLEPEYLNKSILSSSVRNCTCYFKWNNDFNIKYCPICGKEWFNQKKITIRDSIKKDLEKSEALSLREDLSSSQFFTEKPYIYSYFLIYNKSKETRLVSNYISKINIDLLEIAKEEISKILSPYELWNPSCFGVWGYTN